MPVLPHAKKKMRVDRRRTEVNKKIRTKAKKAISVFRENPNQKLLGEAYSAIDRAAKKGVYHVRKADRLKSRLSKFLVKSKKKD